MTSEAALLRMLQHLVETPPDNPNYPLGRIIHLNPPLDIPCKGRIFPLKWIIHLACPSPSPSDFEISPRYTYM